jgi:DedD protein
MNELTKKRVIGAGALVLVAAVAVWIIKTLATPAAVPEGQSVRVYEILPGGQARAVGDDQSDESTSDQAEPARQSQSSAVDSAARSQPAPEQKKAAPEPPRTPEREVLAPTADPAPTPDTRPTPAPRPEPKPSRADTDASSKPATPQPAAGDWLVQVGSFGEQENADRLLEKLAPNYPVQVVKARVNGKTYYRVQAGPYAAESTAKSAQKKLQGQGYGARAMQAP